MRINEGQGFRKYFVVEGRASLSEFWWFQLIWVVAYLSIIQFSNNEPIVFFSLGIIILIAIPLFIFMGIMLEKTKIGYE